MKATRTVMLWGIAVLFARAQSDSGSSFEVASVKPATPGCGSSGPRLGIRSSPGRLGIECQTLEFLIREAYLADGTDPLFADPVVYNQKIQGLPPWAGSEPFTIDAVAGGGASRQRMMGPMLRALLEERFMVRVHREAKEVPVYLLRTDDKRALPLRPASDESCRTFDPESTDAPKGLHICGILVRSLVAGTAPATFYGATLAEMCRGLSRIVGEKVIDRTDIKGRFDIPLDISPSDLFPNLKALQAGSASADSADDASGPRGASVFVALRQLGLKLERARGTMDFLVIDQVQMPAPN